MRLVLLIMTLLLVTAVPASAGLFGSDKVIMINSVGGGGSNLSYLGKADYLSYFPNTTHLNASRIYYNGSHVGIFDSTPDAMVDINIEDPSTEGLIVQGFAGQTAPLFDVRSNVPDIYFVVGASGQANYSGSEICTAANGLCNQTGDGSGGWTNTSTQTKTSLIVNVSNTTTKTSLIYANTNEMKVGIGTNSPLEPLHVVSTTPSITGIRLNGILSITNSSGTLVGSLGSQYTAGSWWLNLGDGSGSAPSAGLRLWAANNYWLSINNAGYAAIGSSAAPSTAQQLLITPSGAAIKGLVVKGATAQSANLQSWMLSNGVTPTYVDNDGDFITSKYSYSANRYGITSSLYAGNTSASGSAALRAAAQSNHATGTLGAIYGYFFDFTANSVSTTDNAYANYGFARQANSGTVNNLIAYRAFTYIDGANRGLVGNMKGFEWVSSSPATGRITTLTGIDLAPSTNAGTMTTYYGLKINDPPNTGTMTTAYAIYINNISQANTTNYAIYSVGGNSLLKAGAKSITPLSLRGEASQTAHLQVWEDSSGTDLAYVNGTGILFAKVPLVEMFSYNMTGWTLNLVTEDVYENLTNMTLHENEGFTLADNKTLTVLKSGSYSTHFDVTFSGTTGSTHGVGVGLNGVIQRECYHQQKLGAIDVTGIDGSCIITVVAGDKITLMADDEDASVNDLTVFAANLNLVRVGG